MTKRHCPNCSSENLYIYPTQESIRNCGEKDFNYFLDHLRTSSSTHYLQDPAIPALKSIHCYDCNHVAYFDVLDQLCAVRIPFELYCCPDCGFGE